LQNNAFRSFFFLDSSLLQGVVFRGEMTYEAQPSLQVLSKLNQGKQKHKKPDQSLDEPS
tara:strand:- start:399 stop:575 length:177 start_codon:yes stop_codon:yes gene_type:complete